MSQYKVFSGPYFPALGLNTRDTEYLSNSIRMWENTDQKKLRIWTLFAQCLKKKFENRVNQVIINCFVFYSCPFLTYQFLIFHFLTSQISSGFKNIQ